VRAPGRVSHVTAWEPCAIEHGGESQQRLPLAVLQSSRGYCRFRITCFWDGPERRGRRGPQRADRCAAGPRVSRRFNSMWEWLSRLDWVDIGFGVVIAAVLVAAWWPTQFGNGE